MSNFLIYQDMGNIFMTMFTIKIAMISSWVFIKTRTKSTIFYCVSVYIWYTQNQLYKHNEQNKYEYGIFINYIFFLIVIITQKGNNNSVFVFFYNCKILIHHIFLLILKKKKASLRRNEGINSVINIVLIFHKSYFSVILY